MKLKVGSTLIFAFGALLAIALSWQLQSRWYMFVLAPFALWAWLYAFEKINTQSFHYDLATTYFGKKRIGACSGCLYWWLVGLSLAAEVSLVVIAVVLQLALYVWVTFWMLFSFKPNWKLNAFRHVFHNEGYMFRRRPATDYRGRPTTQMDLSLLMPLWFVLPVVIPLAALHIGTPQIGRFYHDTQWYVTAPLTYGLVLAFGGFVELWRVTGWPVMKWAYHQACPAVEFVEKVRVPAEPQRPATTNPN